MAGEVQDQVWPLPKFYFEVKIDGTELYFSEVSGLSTEVEVIEYRHGKSKLFAPSKMPGMAKVSDVTLKKGTFSKDVALFDWFNQIKLNTIKRKDVVISLLNEQGKNEIIWTLEKAFPIKFEATDLDAKNNDVAIETIVLTHEGLSVKKG